MKRAGRGGFSLAEALVVLAISSMLLILLAEVSSGASRRGFRLAARAERATGALVGAEALRALLRGVRLPEGPRDAPFIGGADRLTAVSTADRPTACGREGPAAVTLALSAAATGSRLSCAASGTGRPAVLLDMAGPGARISYALAGRPWSSDLVLQPPAQRPGQAAAAPPRLHLWIRLGFEGGEIIEAVEGGVSNGRQVDAGAKAGAG